jgi:hypothetical protein
MIEVLARMTSATIASVYEGHGVRAAHLAAEIKRLEGEAGNLVRFLAAGGDSQAVRSDLRDRETALEGLRTEWETIRHAAALPSPEAHPAWVIYKLKHLDELMGRDPRRAKMEVLKHLDGDLKIAPLPSIVGERRAEITGRAKSESLLSDQEAIRLQVVAGAGFEPATFGL